MADTERSSRRRTVDRAGGAWGGFYFIGGIGALVYFWQQADSLGGYLLAILKSFVWPAFFVYDAFGALATLTTG
ncbi:MAG: hypothetical protein ACFCVF_09765 [Kineosporiaceae bacterium]